MNNDYEKAFIILVTYYEFIVWLLWLLLYSRISNKLYLIEWAMTGVCTVSMCYVGVFVRLCIIIWFSIWSWVGILLNFVKLGWTIIIHCEWRLTISWVKRLERQACTIQNVIDKHCYCFKQEKSTIFFTLGLKNTSQHPNVTERWKQWMKTIF